MFYEANHSPYHNTDRTKQLRTLLEKYFFKRTIFDILLIVLLHTVFVTHRSPGQVIAASKARNSNTGQYERIGIELAAENHDPAADLNNRAVVVVLVLVRRYANVTHSQKLPKKKTHAHTSNDRKRHA